MKSHWTRLGAHGAKCAGCGKVLDYNKVWCTDNGLFCSPECDKDPQVGC